MSNSMANEKRLIRAHATKRDTTKYTRPEGAGNFDNMDDFNIVDFINVKTGTCDLEPQSGKHIVNKDYVDNQNLWETNGTTNCVQLKIADCINFLDNFVYFDEDKKVGLIAVAGDLGVGLEPGKVLKMNTNKITDVVDPTDNQDVATKKYTDDAIDTDITTHAAITTAHHTKYTDAEAVTAVATADKYLKNDADDTTTGKITTIAPTADLHCATKKYVDDNVNSLPTVMVIATMSANFDVPDEIWTKMEFDTAPTNIGTQWDTTDFEFTAAAEGYYLVTASGDIDDCNDGNRAQIAVFKNGDKGASHRHHAPKNSLVMVLDVTAVVFLEVDDIISIRQEHNEGNIQVSRERAATLSITQLA